MATAASAPRRGVGCPSLPAGRHRVAKPSVVEKGCRPVALKGPRGLAASVEIEGCPLPEDRLYDLENDVWWKEEPGTGTALLGVLGTLSAFAGRFVQLTFRPVDTPLARGRSVATVESVRYTGAVRLPVDATILERNTAVADRPRLLNDAPYAEGWVVRARPTDPTEPSRRLESAAAIASRLEQQIRERRIRCWPKTPETELIEIGLECSAVLTKLNEEVARSGAGRPSCSSRTTRRALSRWSDGPTRPAIPFSRTGGRARSTSSWWPRRRCRSLAAGAARTGPPRGSAYFSIGVRTRFPHSVHDPS